FAAARAAPVAFGASAPDRDLAHRQAARDLALDGFAQASVQDDPATRQTSGLLLQSLRRDWGPATLYAQRLEGDRPRRLIALERADDIPQRQDLERLACIRAGTCPSQLEPRA